MHTEKLCSQTYRVFCSNVWVEEGFQLSATREEHVQTHEDLSMAYPGPSRAIGYSLIGCHRRIRIMKSLQVARICKKMLSTWFWWSGWNHHEMWSLEILSNWVAGLHSWQSRTVRLKLQVKKIPKIRINHRYITASNKKRLDWLDWLDWLDRWQLSVEGSKGWSKETRRIGRRVIQPRHHQLQCKPCLTERHFDFKSKTQSETIRISSSSSSLKYNFHQFWIWEAIFVQCAEAVQEETGPQADRSGSTRINARSQDASHRSWESGTDTHSHSSQKYFLASERCHAYENVVSYKPEA